MPRIKEAASEFLAKKRIAVTGVERVFTAQPEFDPGSSTREFTLLVSDYVVAILGDTIAELLAEEAPHTRLRFTPHSPAIVGPPSPDASAPSTACRRSPLDGCCPAVRNIGY